jgi:hypothetical protein
MKKLLLHFFIGVSSLLLSMASVSTLRAQESGSIISLAALGGVQESSLTGIKSGQYYSVRGSLFNFFAELRHDEWGNSASYVRDNGIVGGIDFSLFHIMVSAGIGLGQSDYQPSSVYGVAPPVLSYSTFIYEGQAMYTFEIIGGILTAGVGLNYVAESNDIAPIYGWGGVAMLSVGL